ncbi:MAG: class I SAM-dependent methyltransferase [Candidatus Bathyarchaeota archaeon]|nr:class I SAM-dependent methyltransferase [Candidatus Bathyarchaeota archaeon]
MFGKISERWTKIEEVKSYYDEKAKNYDETFEILYFKVYDAITWKYIEPYVPTDPNALVLDAGGGTGRWAIQMARKGCKVVLMDLSDGMLKAATERVKAEGLEDSVIVRKGDITKTSYDDETFDMILCEHALFLFKEPDFVLKEFRRILKKKGLLIISAQNRYVQSLSSLSSKPSVDNVERTMKILENVEHECMTEDGLVKIYTRTPDELRNMLERNGFRVEKIIGKVLTMPLRIRKEFYMQREYSEELFNKILQLELSLCEKPDALALAGHLQAIVRKM